jgi:signal transduction histidine kinase
VAVFLSVQEGWLSLKIRDNGVGIQPSSQKKQGSFGLIGMEERVLSLDGKFSVTSMPDKGTTVFISIPYHLSGTTDTQELTVSASLKIVRPYLEVSAKTLKEMFTVAI